jgi:hypothetical protein
LTISTAVTRPASPEATDGIEEAGRDDDQSTALDLPNTLRPNIRSKPLGASSERALQAGFSRPYLPEIALYAALRAESGGGVLKPP